MDINLEEDIDISKENISKLKNFVGSSDIEEIIQQKNRFSSPGKDEEIKKIIDCPHEIIFTITAHSLEQNDKGETIGSKHICVKNYHIPVPIDKDHLHYMSIFFDYLEQKILDGISNANDVTKDKEENINE